MQKASLVAIAVLAAGCAMSRKEPPPRPFAGTPWRVILELSIPGEQPTLRFGDGLMEGFGGCNRITARYVQDTVGARAIAFGRVERGTRACERRAQMAENRLLEVLQGATSYSITGDVLTITGSAGSLKMKAPPQPAAPAEAK